MKIHHFTARQVIPVTQERAWDFFSSPGNLSLITPPGLKFRITSTDMPEKIYKGLQIDYRVSPLLNVPVRWLTKITEAEEPFSFVDEQLKGPYRYWKHQHFFNKVDGGIEMRDDVSYAIGFGFFGEVLNYMMIRKKIEEIFEYRRKKITEIFSIQ